MTKIKVVLFLVLTAALLILWDVARFAHRVRDYGTHAQKGPAQLTSEVDEKEAIVVLTGDNRRILKALELMQSRDSPTLIISGTDPRATLTDLVNQQGASSVNLRDHWDRITLEPQSTTTIENARESAKILKSRAIARVILVTSDYHMHRALAIFHAVWPEVDFETYAVPSTVTEIRFSPSRQTLDGISRFLVEYVKYLAYRLLYSSSLGSP